MATGTVQFQSATLASPPAALAVMADAVSHSTLGAGSAQFVKLMNGAVGGTAGVEATEANGLEVDVTRVQGTVQALGTFQPLAGSVHLASGTVQALGTFQPLAGSVHLASGTVTVLGTIQTHGTSQVLGSVQGVGTFQVLGSVQPVGTVQVLGTIQTHGTVQALGTFQPLAGSVHLAAGSVNAQGVVAHGAAALGNPILFGGFGSSGTQAAVDDGDLVRPWLDLNGRMQMRGTIDSIPNITVSSMPTVTVTGTVQTHGTSQALGTFQPLAGSVHVANTISGTVQTHGTSQALGTFQSHGTNQALGTVQTHGTSQVLGTVQTHGTSQALGTFQPLAGSVHLASGTVQVLGSVQAVGTTQTKQVRSNAPIGTRIAGTIGNLILLAANTNRLGASFYVESGAPLYLKWGSLSGTFDYTTQINAGALYEVPYGYVGTISGIWQVANGTVQITEVS